MSGVTSVALACAALERAEREEQERRYPARLYRALSRAIDEACEEVELVNLAGGGACPGRAGALIEYLQLLAGEPVAKPETSVQAHEVLFHLAAVLLGRPAELPEPRPSGRRSRAA